MKIAHISDFHLRHHLPGTSTISRRLSRHMPELITQAVGRIRGESPDLVVVTGDLADHPFYGMHDEELIALGEKDLRLIRECFAPLTCPVAWLYGNHDHPSPSTVFTATFPRISTLPGIAFCCFSTMKWKTTFPSAWGSSANAFSPR